MCVLYRDIIGKVQFPHFFLKSFILSAFSSAVRNSGHCIVHRMECGKEKGEREEAREGGRQEGREGDRKGGGGGQSRRERGTEEKRGKKEREKEMGRE